MISVGALTGFACDTGECDRGRLEMAAKWEDIRDTAAALKRTPDWDESQLAERRARSEVWGKIAEQAELVRSSFVTEQVTWRAAHHGTDELSSAFRKAPQEVKSGVVAEGFGALVASAGGEMRQFEQQCR